MSDITSAEKNRTNNVMNIKLQLVSEIYQNSSNEIQDSDGKF
jgi:hypothetical protein